MESNRNGIIQKIQREFYLLMNQNVYRSGCTQKKKKIRSRMQGTKLTPTRPPNADISCPGRMKIDNWAPSWPVKKKKKKFPSSTSPKKYNK